MNKKIQDSLKASPAIETRPDNARDNRYIWFPLHRIDVEIAPASAPFSVSAVEPRYLTLIQSIVYWGRDESDELLNPLINPHDSPVLKRLVCSALEQERALQTRYGNRGLVSIQAFVGEEPARVADFQARLVDLVGEEAWESMTLQELAALLEAVEPRNETERQALIEMANSTQTAISWATNHLNAVEKELQDAFTGKTGRGFVTEFDRAIYAAVGRPTPREKNFEYEGRQHGASVERAISMMAEALAKLAEQKQPVQSKQAKEK